MKRRREDEQERRSGGEKKSRYKEERRKQKPPLGVAFPAKAPCFFSAKAPYGSRTHDLRITSATLYH